MRAVLISLAFFSSITPNAFADRARVFAFVDVTVVRAYGEPTRPHQTVLVCDDRIVGVTPTRRVRLPRDALVLNHPGHILAPGLADMHVHIFNPDDGILFLANGVTTVRNMNGRDDTNALAQRIDTGLTPGPHIYSSGPIINSPSADWIAVASTPARIRALIADEARSGYIAVKLYETLAPDVFAAGVTAARDNGLQVYAHVPFSMTLQQVLDLHIDSIEHLTGFDRALAANARSDWDEERWANADVRRMAPLARRVARSDVWNDATLVTLLDAPCAFANIAAAEAAPEYRYATPRQRTLWRSQSQEASAEHELQGSCAMSRRAHAMRLAMLRTLHAAHAPLLIGTDAPQPYVYPGFSLQRELAFHLEAGFTRTEILRIASRDAARFLHQQHEFGIIEAGARADLLLLDGDPSADLDNLRHPAGVMAAGRWYDAATLQRLLDEAAARTRAPAHP
jgi:imidazolonepropionase-like amidohydrolase